MSGEECESRVRRYLAGLEAALESVGRRLGEGYSRLVDAARRYAEDARYYLSSGDCETALAAASYAEGLLDSLKYLGVLEPEWPRDVAGDVERRVFVAGTFDILHPGHVELFRAASRYGRVYAVIARDSTVERLKGRKPVLPEDVRLELVSAIKYVYKAMLGDPVDHLASVGRVRPDVIVLGPDQPYEPESLAKTVERRFGFRPLVVKLGGKRVFSGSMKSSSDIIRKICSSSLCESLGEPRGPEA